jgi:hypothetical protein
MLHVQISIKVMTWILQIFMSLLPFIALFTVNRQQAKESSHWAVVPVEEEEEEEEKEQ